MYLNTLICMFQAAHMSEEVKDAAKSVPKAMMSVYLINFVRVLSAIRNFFTSADDFTVLDLPCRPYSLLPYPSRVRRSHGSNTLPHDLRPPRDHVRWLVDSTTDCHRRPPHLL